MAPNAPRCAGLAHPLVLVIRSFLAAEKDVSRDDWGLRGLMLQSIRRRLVRFIASQCVNVRSRPVHDESQSVVCSRSKHYTPVISINRGVSAPRRGEISPEIWNSCLNVRSCPIETALIRPSGTRSGLLRAGSSPASSREPDLTAE